jgi:hypothetical protein
MDATALSSTALGQRHSTALPSLIRDSAAAILTALLLFAAAFLLARRWAGGLSEHLAALTLIGVGGVAVITAEVIRSLNQRVRSAGQTTLSPPRFWFPFAALPVLAYAVSVPGSSFFGLSMLWLMIVGEEVRLWRNRKTTRPFLTSSRSTIAAPKINLDDRRSSVEPSPPADWHNPAIAQQLVYRRTADNIAAVEGWLRASFAAGQRTAIVHVAFCPPFAGVPRVEAEPLDGTACEIRPTLVLPWGVRWECKLSDPATATTSVVLEFFAAESFPEPLMDQR